MKALIAIVITASLASPAVAKNATPQRPAWRGEFTCASWKLPLLERPAGSNPVSRPCCGRKFKGWCFHGRI